MFTWMSRLLGFGALCAALPLAYGQPAKLDARSTLHISFPEDSPLAVLSADWGESRASQRGGAMLLDLRTSLVLRNATQRRIRGVTLLVLAQEVTPGGKASVSVPSLDVSPGEAFPVRIDLRLLRPLETGSGPLVEVGLDGVLFEDLSFYGANKLNSRRTMTAWELEAQRDRRYFRSLLETAGADGLQREMIETLARLSDRPRWDVQVARGRPTNVELGHSVQLAALQLPEAPVEAFQGSVMVNGAEAWAPRLEVRNRGPRPVKHLEIGWLLADRQGTEFHAGSLPATVDLAPGQRAQIEQERTLRVAPRGGQPVDITGMTAFVSQVEFADGGMWIPSQASLRRSKVQRTLMPSPEEQRLAELYRKKGLTAVVEELKKFGR